MACTGAAHSCWCWCNAGYARRGLRSAITSATKEGITVQEVMTPPAGSLGSTHLGPQDCAASADWSEVAAEMRAVDDKWAASKTGRARKWGCSVDNQPRALTLNSRTYPKYRCADLQGVLLCDICTAWVCELLLQMHNHLTAVEDHVPRPMLQEPQRVCDPMCLR